MKVGEIMNKSEIVKSLEEKEKNLEELWRSL